MSPRAMGRVAAVLIVAFWATMTWKLLRREVFLPRLDMARLRVPAALPGGAADRFQEDWNGIYYDDVKVGVIHSTITRTSDAGYTIRSDARIALRLLDRDFSVQFNGMAMVGAGGVPEQMMFEVQAGPAKLEVRGRRHGDQLDLEVVSAGRIVHKAIPITDALTLSNAVTPALYWPQLEAGTTYTLDVLDPLSLSTRPAKVHVSGREKLAFGGGMVETTVLEFDYDGLTFTTWVSDSGVVLRQESELGWYLVRETEEEAKRGFATGEELQRVINDFATIYSTRRFADSQALVYLRARLGGVPIAGLQLNGAHQRLVDDQEGIIEVVRRQPAAADALPLPIRDAAFAAYLEPQLFVQSDDPAIVATARAIVGTETNSWRAAQKLGDWVYATLEKDLLAGIPSAVEILELKRGDCNEHTTLFTALARASGIPTRFTVGVVYNRGRYYYHAWPEVYVGQWVAMDPTFGQDTADATHIKLLEGDLTQQSRLATVMGRLEIEVLADSEQPHWGQADS